MPPQAPAYQENANANVQQLHPNVIQDQVLQPPTIHIPEPEAEFHVPEEAQGLPEAYEPSGAAQEQQQQEAPEAMMPQAPLYREEEDVALVQQQAPAVVHANAIQQLTIDIPEDDQPQIRVPRTQGLLKICGPEDDSLSLAAAALW